MSGDTIEVDISLDAPALVPGDTASLRFRMTTRAPLRIRGAHAHFIGYEDRHTETAVTEKVVQRRGPTYHLFSPFDVRLPDTLIPTCRGAKFSVTYELAVSLEVPGAKDPTVRVPVTIV